MPATEAPKAAGIESSGLLESLQELTKEIIPSEAKPAKRAAKPAPEPEKPAEPPVEKAKDDGALPDIDAPVTPLKADAKPPGDDGVPAEIKTEQGKADWKTLREARRKSDDENVTLKKRVAELEATPAPDTTEIESLRKTLADYEARLTVTNLERHPKFEEFFNGKTKSLLDQAKTIAGDRMATILQLPDGEYRNTQLKEAFSELDPVGQSRIGSVINSLDDIRTAKQTELARAGEVLKNMEAQRQHQAKLQQEAQARVLDDLFARWGDPEKGHPMFQTKADDKDWNAGVEKRRTMAKQVYNGNLDVKDLAKAAAWAAAGPELATSLKNANARIAELEGKLTDLKAAKPGSINGASGEEGADDGKTGFIDAVMKQYRR